MFCYSEIGNDYWGMMGVGFVEYVFWFEISVDCGVSER